MTPRPYSLGSDKRKQSLYFPEEMLREIEFEANRLDRSLSWVVQMAWRIGLPRVREIPSFDEVLP